MTVLIEAAIYKQTLDKRGTDFYDADLDRAFVNELKKRLRSEIGVREVEADLDTPQFAQAIVDAFDEIMVS